MNNKEIIAEFFGSITFYNKQLKHFIEHALDKQKQEFIEMVESCPTSFIRGIDEYGKGWNSGNKKVIDWQQELINKLK